jgi:hypothetical protein
MSHTDKDEPYWVTRATSDLVRHDHRSGVCREETLDDIKAAKRHWPAVRFYPWGAYAGAPKSITCTREHPTEGAYSWPSPPNWYVGHRYTRPERRQARDMLADLKKWRFEDMEDFDYPDRQGRGSARYDWM